MTLVKKTPRKLKPKLRIVSNAGLMTSEKKPTLQDGKASLTSLPYTTRTGLRIGAYYTPRQQVRMSRDDEFWQGILLGDKPKSNLPFIAYIIGLIVLIKNLMEYK